MVIAAFEITVKVNVRHSLVHSLSSEMTGNYLHRCRAVEQTVPAVQHGCSLAVRLGPIFAPGLHSVCGQTPVRQHCVEESTQHLTDSCLAPVRAAIRKVLFSLRVN